MVSGKYNRTIENRKNISMAQKRKWKDKEYKEKTSKAISNALKNNENVSIASKKNWENPDYKTKIINETSNKKRSEILKGRKYSKQKYPKWGWRTNRKNQVLPVKDTTIEIKIQNFLTDLKIEFVKHKYIEEIEHSYQCDVFIPSINLVIECDGDYWHNYPEGNEIDHIKTQELYDAGFNVLRLWERDIRVMDINKFRENIQNCI